MSLENFRAQFPGAARRIYLDSAGIGLSSRAATEAVARFLALAEIDPRGAHHGDAHQRAREAAARLVGADVAEIALIPSTSLALNTAADSVPIGPDDNVITTDLEFMSVVSPWIEKCRAARAELRVARHVQGRIDPESVIALMDRTTRAVTLSAVQWTNGHCVDIAPIGAECRLRGIPFIVDAIQAVGVTPFDVAASHADFIVCGGHKWLGSPSAMGFAWAREAFADRYRPTLSYVPTSQPPDTSWAASWTEPGYDPIRTYALKPAAARFEQGVHHGGLGAVALAAAIGVHLDVGVGAIQSHAARLARWVADGVAELGLALVTPPDAERRSGITVFRAGLDAADDLTMRDALAERGIDVSVRYTSGVGGVRVSTHGYNDDAEVDALLDAIARIRAGSRASAPNPVTSPR